MPKCQGEQISPVQRKRHLTARERREAAQKARDYRLNFLRNLKSGHPLYSSVEARMARGEAAEDNSRLPKPVAHSRSHA